MPGDVIQCPRAIERKRKIIALAEFTTDPGQELGIGLILDAHGILRLMEHAEAA